MPNTRSSVKNTSQSWNKSQLFLRPFAIQFDAKPKRPGQKAQHRLKKSSQQFLFMLMISIVKPQSTGKSAMNFVF